MLSRFHSHSRLFQNPNPRFLRSHHVMQRLSGHGAALILILAIFIPATLAADNADWQATLVESRDEGSRRRPADEIRITLPGDLDLETVRWLALELDNLDVSKLVSLKGNQVVVKPPQPLSPGEHTLRLVQYTPEGAILERGSWTLEISPTSAFGEASLAGKLTVQGSRLAADKETGDENPSKDRNMIDGSAELQGKLAKDEWEASINFPVYYNSREELATGGEGSIGLGNFSITGRLDQAFVNLGHQSPGGESLIVGDFSRRGLSAGLELFDGNFSATGFILRTEPVTGFRYGLGIGDDKKRLSGSLLRLNPLPGDPERLELTVTYITGEGSDGSGAGVSGDPAGTSGSAWSVAADSRLLGKMLRLRGEFAATQYDFGGSDGGGQEKDEAYSFLTVFSLWNKPVFSWDLGLTYKQIGLFFKSLANTGLPSDMMISQAFTAVKWGGLAIDAAISRAEDNVGKLESLPRNRRDLVEGSVKFISPEAGSGNSTGWLGQPSLGLSYKQAVDKTLSLPKDQEEAGIDALTREVRAEVGSNYQFFSWKAGYGRGWQDDFTDISPDTLSNQADLSLGFHFGERLSLSFGGSWSLKRDLDHKTDFTGWSGQAGGQAVLIKDRLTWSLSYGFQREKATDESVGSQTQTASSGLELKILEPKAYRPALSCWVRGDFQDIKDLVGDAPDKKPYQVFLGATLSWSPP